MGRQRRVKEKELLEAIVGSRGFKSTIAARLHCSWQAVNNAINASIAAQEAIRAEEETTLDFVEGKAITKTNEGDGAMIRFYLATKGKKRGYCYEDEQTKDDITADTEVNINVTGGEPAPIGFTVDDKADA